VVSGKAGKATFGLNRFYSSLQQHPISGLALFVFSMINVREEKSFPV
jgi:hypothetical protein